jgi:hypothetical protein
MHRSTSRLRRSPHLLISGCGGPLPKGGPPVYWHPAGGSGGYVYAVVKADRTVYTKEIVNRLRRKVSPLRLNIGAGGRPHVGPPPALGQAGSRGRSESGIDRSASGLFTAATLRRATGASAETLRKNPDPPVTV